MKTRSKIYLHYDPNLTVKQISERAGVSETAVKKFIVKNDLGSKHEQNFLVTLRKVENAVDKLSKSDKPVTNQVVAELTGLSSKTVAKYRKILDEKAENKSTKKVAYFSNGNGNVIKSVSNDQSQILAWALKLYSPTRGIDFDLTFSTGGFYKSGIPEPKYRFDKYPCIDGVSSLDDAEKLTSERPNSLRFGIVDPPHIVSGGESIDHKGKTNIVGSNIISDRFSCFSNLYDLYSSNEDLIALSSKLLAKDGVLLYKVQDTVTSGKSVFTHLYVIDKAKEYGLELEDIFVLTAKNRIISPKHANQKHARKYHSFILVFKKQSDNNNIKNMLNNSYLRDALNAAFAASVPVMEIYRNASFNVRKKEDKSKVSDGDIAAHDTILQQLSHTGIHVVSEENYDVSDLTKDRFWIVDPIDGTREYITGGNHFSINVALIESHRPTVSVIYFPSTATLYFAVKGSGAYKIDNVYGFAELLNRIDSIQRLPLKTDAERPYKMLIRKFDNPTTPAAMGTNSHVKTILKQRPYAVVEAYEASIKFCLVAEGNADYYFHAKGVKQWDVACGDLLVQESGGKVVVKDTDERVVYGGDDIAMPSIQVFK